MNHDQKSEAEAEAQKNESVFVFRVVGVVDQQAVFVGEHRLRVVEGDAVLAQVGLGFPWIPLEADARHPPIVGTSYIRRKSR